MPFQTLATRWLTAPILPRTLRAPAYADGPWHDRTPRAPRARGEGLLVDAWRPFRPSANLPISSHKEGFSAVISAVTSVWTHVEQLPHLVSANQTFHQAQS